MKAREDRREEAGGVRRAYTILFLLMMQLVEELGSDRALEMLRKAAERQAEIFMKEFGGGISTRMSPIEMGLEAHKTFMEELGARVETHGRNGTGITLRVEGCPLYEAMIDVGIDCGYLQGGLCANLILPTIQEILKMLDPRLRLRAKLTRRSLEEFCLEEIYLES